MNHQSNTDYARKNLAVVEKELHGWLSSLNGKYSVLYCTDSRLLRLLQWCNQKNGNYDFSILYHTARYFRNDQILPTLTIDEAGLRTYIGLEAKDYDSFFNDFVASKALSLGLPMEVGFPVYYHDIPSEIADKEAYTEFFVKGVAEVISSVMCRNDNSIHLPYHITTRPVPFSGKKISTYTIFYDTPSREEAGDKYFETVNYIKLRFFTTEERIAIVSCRVETLYSSSLNEKCTYMRTPKLEKAWNVLYSQLAKAPTEQNGSELSRLSVLPMLCNYIMSYDYFNNYIDYIEGRLKCKITRPLSEDLALLVGRSTAVDFFDTLAKPYQQSVNGKQTITTRIRLLRQHNPTLGKLPKHGNVDFNMEAKDWMRQCRSIEQCVDAEFSAMKHIFTVTGNNVYKSTLYGETLYSISQRIEKNCPDVAKKEKEYYRKKLVMAIDNLIDVGAVDTNYILHSEPEQIDRWILVYTYTNGETFKERLLRCFLYLWRKLAELNKDADVNYGQMELLLDLLGKIGMSDNLFLAEPYTNEENCQDEEYISNPFAGVDKQRGVLTLADDLDMLPGSNTSYTFSLGKGTPWDDIVNSNVDAVFKMLADFCEDYGDVRNAFSDLKSLFFYNPQNIVEALKKYFDSIRIAYKEGINTKESIADIAFLHKQLILTLEKIPAPESEMKGIKETYLLSDYGMAGDAAAFDLKKVILDRYAEIDGEMMAELRKSTLLAVCCNFLYLFWYGFMKDNAESVWEKINKIIYGNKLQDYILAVGVEPNDKAFIEKWKALPASAMLSCLNSILDSAQKVCNS